MAFDPTLAHQSRGRDPTPAEAALAAALEEIFATGTHDFDAVAQQLSEKGVARPSGAKELWTRAVLEAELAAINREYDAAYAAHGRGAV